MPHNPNDDGFGPFRITRSVLWILFALIAGVNVVLRQLTIAGGLESWEKTLILTCWIVMSFIVASAVDKATR